jgi:hypothetical protein
MTKKNIDEKVVSDFGKEWKAFNHHTMNNLSLQSSFDSYFSIFPRTSKRNVCKPDLITQQSIGNLILMI